MKETEISDLTTEVRVLIRTKKKSEDMYKIANAIVASLQSEQMSIKLSLVEKETRIIEKSEKSYSLSLLLQD